MRRVVDTAILSQDPHMITDTTFMEIALLEAKKAYRKHEVPVGAVLVIDDKVIAKAHNKRQTSNNPLSHAEINVIKKASKKLGHWILDDATLYITLEPCLMCSGLILQSRIKRVVFAAFQPKFGTAGSKMDVLSTNDFNHQVEVTSGILEKESQQLLQSFFQTLRKQK